MSSERNNTGNHVKDILEYNLAKQQEHEKPIVPKKAKYKKKRDYILGMIIVNAMIFLPYIVLDRNIVIGIFTLSGIAIFSSGFTWIVWQVINDY